MFALLQIVALCVATAADAAPGYTVHVRELTTPESAARVPLIGSVTVSDAVDALKRPSGDLVRMDLWVVRPVAGGKDRVLPIDWTGITSWGKTSTNYLLFAGDRLFLQARPARK